MTSCVRRGKTNRGPVVRLDCGEGQTEEATCTGDRGNGWAHFRIGEHVGPWQVIEVGLVVAN